MRANINYLTRTIAASVATVVLCGCVAEVPAAVDAPALESEVDVGSSEAALVPHPNCSDETQTRMQEVIDATKPLVDAAIRDVQSGNDHAMVRWFGESLDASPPAFSWGLTAQDRRDGLLNVLTWMRSELDSGEPLRCGGDGCTDSTLGVVNHTDYWLRDDDTRIRLCSSVWDLPLLGRRNSITEVLVHELAHFVTATGVTDVSNAACDWWNPENPNACYGYESALKLATVDARGAEANAENYAGFVSEAFIRPALLAVIL
jgi:hypothetical protein